MFEHVGETHSTRVLFCAGSARCMVVDALLSLQRLQEMYCCPGRQGPRLVRSFLPCPSIKQARVRGGEL